MLKGVRSDVLANAAVHMQVGAEYERNRNQRPEYYNGKSVNYAIFNYNPATLSLLLEGIKRCTDLL